MASVEERLAKVEQEIANLEVQVANRPTKRGWLKNVGTMDLRIGTIAIADQMTLLTQNTVHFERIPNLQFDDWMRAL